MDETGRAGSGVRAEKNAQLLQINRFGDVEEVQHPEIAARDYSCGTDVPEMWLCRWCDSHRRLDAWTRRRRTQGFLVFWLLKKKEVRELHADDTGFTPGHAGAQQCCAPTGSFMLRGGVRL